MDGTLPRGVQVNTDSTAASANETHAVTWRYLLVFIAVVTALKAVAVLLVFTTPRTWEDGTMALNFVRTGSFFITRYGVDNHSYQFPVYMTLVGGAYRLFGVHPQLACLLNVALSGATACLFIPLFSRWLDEVDLPSSIRPYKPAIVSVSVAGFVLHPIVSYYALNNIHPFSIDVLMFYATMLAIFLYVDRGQRRQDLVLLGLFLGIVLLTRSTLIVTMLLFIYLVYRRSGLIIALTHASFAVAIALLVGVPWLMRNYRVDQVVGYTSTTGENIWTGVVGNSEGSNYRADGSTYISALSEDDLTLLRTLSIRQQDEFFLQKYRDIVVGDPGHAARMFMLKLRNFFWFRPLIGNAYSAAIRRVMPVYFLMYGVTLLLALLSVVLIGRSTLPLWALIVALSLFQAAFYVETRHRVLIEPLLMLLAVISLSMLVEPLRRRRGRGAMIPA